MDLGAAATPLLGAGSQPLVGLRASEGTVGKLRCSETRTSEGTIKS